MFQIIGVVALFEAVEALMRAALAARDISTVYRLLRRVGVSQRQIAALTGQAAEAQRGAAIGDAAPFDLEPGDGTASPLQRRLGRATVEIHGE